MANRRTLKKQITAACSDLFADCVALSLCPEANAEQLNALMQEVLTLHADFIARVSHTEKGSEKLFYSRLRSDFDQKTDALSLAITKA